MHICGVTVGAELRLSPISSPLRPARVIGSEAAVQHAGVCRSSLLSLHGASGEHKGNLPEYDDHTIQLAIHLTPSKANFC